MDSIQTSKHYSKTRHNSCHKTKHYAIQKVSQKMLIQMYMHTHLTLDMTKQSPIKTHQATTETRKYLIALKKPK